MRKYLLTLLLIPCTLCLIYAQGTWKTLPKAAPDANAGIMLLLTDGTVMVLSGAGTSGNNAWDLLTPDAQGSYLNGTWTQLPAMNDTRLYCGTQVMPDGNIYVGGAEYGTGGSTGELYNTTTKTWTYINGVPGGWTIYDGNSEILYDGTVLQGCQITPAPSSTDNLIFNEPTNLFTTATPCFGSHDEASWVKLPDSSVINVDMGTVNTERYIPQQKIWVTDATVPTNLYDGALFETGAGFLLPNGNVFFLGDAQYTAIYTPSGNASNGSWALGPAMPIVAGVQLGCPDAAAAMMPTGNILCDFSPAGTYNTPTYFYEFNYLTNTFTQVKSPTGADTLNTSAFATNMLDLPDGTVLFSDQGDNNYYQYTPKGSPIASGKPTINSIIPNCPSFKITGKLFNGISEGAAYGDDWQCATDYPIVRLTNGTNVYYARTANWNRIGAVMTDSLEDTTNFTVPAMPAGTYSVVVIANGIASNPYSLTLPCVMTGMAQLSTLNPQFSIYPNPGNGIFTVEMKNEELSPPERERAGMKNVVEVYNVLGEKIVPQFRIQNSEFKIDISGQPSGIYFYKIFNDTGTLMGKGKLVIQK